MATSQSHKLGEFIGNFFEDLMKQPIRNFAQKNSLYFDSIGERKARDSKKLTWIDIHGNKHDLDFVIEKGGSEETIGEPIAFIEIAWRRYTKHSKNKAQEISGAINPVCEKYNMTKPFKGAILCGEFTETALNQLRSEEFHVLYIPFEKMVQAFSKYGFDINYDEKTKEEDIEKKIQCVTKSSKKEQMKKVRQEILNTCNKEISQFISELEASYKRKIMNICILPLHGTRTEVDNIETAINYINGYEKLPNDSKLEYIAIIVTYNNGSIIQGQFKSKEEAVDFLNKIS